MNATAACPVAYYRGEAGHRDLHDIPPCLGTCGPLRPGLGREHDPACLNAHMEATMTEQATRPTHGGIGPEPFIEFPRWGLLRALGDHEARCSACAGNLTAECADKWYSDMLRDKIARLSRGR